MTERFEIIAKLDEMIYLLERGLNAKGLTLEQLHRVKSDVEFADFWYSMIEVGDLPEELKNRSLGGS